MVYSDTINKTGILQDAEIALYGDNGYGQITGNPNRLLQFTARVNRRQDMFIKLAFEADGTWDYDDTNYTDFPTATTAIVSGQRDYSFDISMLEIEKVMILPSATATAYVTIYPVDIKDKLYSEIALNNPNNTGTPYRYDKQANSVILDPTPNFSVLAGIKVIFKRPAFYFISTDTSRSPGFSILFHNYLSRGSALDYAVDRIMPIAATLVGQVALIEKSISSFYNRRTLDERKTMTMMPIPYM